MCPRYPRERARPPRPPPPPPPWRDRHRRRDGARRGACGRSNGSHTVTSTPAAAACRAAVTAAASPSNTSPGTVHAVLILEACPDRVTIDAELRRVAGPEDVTQEERQLAVACRAVHPVPASCADFTSHQTAAKRHTCPPRSPPCLLRRRRPMSPPETGPWMEHPATTPLAPSVQMEERSVGHRHARRSVRHERAPPSGRLASSTRSRPLDRTDC
jgi:hypothetical protein